MTHLRRLFALLVGIFQRALCCLKSNRSRRNSGSLLPLTVKNETRAGGDPYQQEHSRPLLSQYSVSQDSWSSQQWQQQQQNSPQELFNPVQADKQSKPISHSNAPVNQVEQEEDDFFKDMTPKLKQQKKVLISTETNNLLSSDKFGVDDSAVPLSLDLAELNDAHDGGERVWEEEVFDIDSTLKEVKEAERKRRQQQHQERLKTNLPSNASKKSLTATRLS